MSERPEVFVLRSLCRVVSLAEPSLVTHSEAAAHVAVSIARETGWDERGLERLHVAGLLHDVGMIGVPEAGGRLHPRRRRGVGRADTPLALVDRAGERSRGARVASRRRGQDLPL